jgi:hypothetical protein
VAGAGFDFDAYRAAVEGGDLDAWLASTASRIAPRSRWARGGRFVEHVILELRKGRIATQVDVEVWD